MVFNMHKMHIFMYFPLYACAWSPPVCSPSVAAVMSIFSKSKYTLIGQSLSGLAGPYRSYCQQLECPHSSLPSWPYYMSSAHRITTPCTCMNYTSCNQPKVVPEPEIQAPRGKEWQRGVGTFELLAVWAIGFIFVETLS